VSGEEEPVGAQPQPSEAAVMAVGPTGAAAESAPLLALVDRLSAILDKGDLGELELRAGATTIIVRSQAALERQSAVSNGPEAATLEVPAAAPAAGAAPAAAPGAPGAPAQAKPSVKAPLTGIYYGAPSPGATPYVSVGDHVEAGQIIGLIEAMKLFNEIKSDLSGRVTRVCAENGQLVKAKQPLIEVERA
jgi:acetyl-CoA carboxylase biotin carboxyl carrier protein